MAQNKEEIIADMLANGLLSDEDAKQYRTNKSVSVVELSTCLDKRGKNML